MPELTALARATAFFVAEGADPATAEQCGREMVNFCRLLVREAQRQAAEEAVHQPEPAAVNS